ncbi:MAG: uncharacterized protein QOH26_544 [Actinomycetota bacterium]|jgi:uncharacterized membrane protein (UPF0127 family)|nr:uncharacterized protein [Actinomycetota bacterium]
MVARTERVLADRTRDALSPVLRLRGLLSDTSMGRGTALILAPARQVHTIGMRFPIDVVFCDKGMRVLHVVHSMRRNRISRFVRGAHFAIELPARTAGDLRVGDQLLSSPL